MKEIVVTKHIGASPAAVFAACTDIPNAAKNISAITNIKMLTPGPVGKGTKFRETRKLMGKEATETMEFLEFTPNKSYLLGAESCGMRYRTSFDFRQNGNGTDVEVRFNATPLTVGARIMGTMMSMFMSGMLRKCLNHDLDEIKKRVESGAV